MITHSLTTQVHDQEVLSSVLSEFKLEVLYTYLHTGRQNGPKHIPNFIYTFM